MLLYNVANSVAQSILEADDRDDEGNDEDDLDRAVGAISDAFSSFAIAPPMLRDYPLALHVQFWDENDKFCFELDEMIINQSVVDTYCSSFTTKPVRALMEFAIEGKGESESESGIEELTHWVPHRGTINLIVTIYAHAPVLVGVISEPFALSGEDRDTQAEGETFQTGGKRIHWLANALTSKRQRVTQGKKEVEDPLQEQDMSDMFLGMQNFGENEYCTSVNSEAAVIGFSFTEDTHQLCQVRVALALHKLVFRLAMQSVLDASRNTL